ncbi:FmdB family zinc ribbon protein [Aurantivibrio infirmus]
MPIYEYQCQSCGHEMEALQKMSDPLLTRCPSCNKEELKKKVSAAAFRLKGGGWYETDFKTGNKKNGVGNETSGSGDAAKSDSGSKASTDKKTDSQSSSGKSADNKSSTTKAQGATTKPSSTAS